MPIISYKDGFAIGHAVGSAWNGAPDEGRYWAESRDRRHLDHHRWIKDDGALYCIDRNGKLNYAATWFDSIDEVEAAISLYHSLQELNTPLSRAKKLRDIALMAYSPPGKGFGDETVAVKTSALITLGFVFGREIFDGVELTEGQRSAIESGLKTLESES